VDKNYGTRLTVHAFPRDSPAKFAQNFSVQEMLPTDTFRIKVTSRRVRATIVAVEKQQQMLHNLSVYFLALVI
jgi:hypothetical protein